MRGTKAKAIRRSLFKRGIAISGAPYTIYGNQVVASKGRRLYQQEKEAAR